MAVSLVFFSDTHVPRRARDLPDCLWDAIVTSDAVIHAGDWVDVALLDLLEERS
ncbi:MAG: YfcE family phosphodiesterase, partial [Blastococcus sp.]|nr:YfcE family phosphodiesterase [Blastococcus sp.]